MATRDLVAESQHDHADIDDSVVPGTVQLIDLDFSLHAKHSKAYQDVVLGMFLISRSGSTVQLSPLHTHSTLAYCRRLRWHMAIT